MDGVTRRISKTADCLGKQPSPPQISHPDRGHHSEEDHDLRFRRPWYCIVLSDETTESVSVCTLTCSVGGYFSCGMKFGDLVSTDRASVSGLAQNFPSSASLRRGSAGRFHGWIIYSAEHPPRVEKMGQLNWASCFWPDLKVSAYACVVILCCYHGPRLLAEQTEASSSATTNAAEFVRRFMS